MPTGLEQTDDHRLLMPSSFGVGTTTTNSSQLMVIILSHSVFLSSLLIILFIYYKVPSNPAKVPTILIEFNADTLSAMKSAYARLVFFVFKPVPNSYFLILDFILNRWDIWHKKRMTETLNNAAVAAILVGSHTNYLQKKKSASPQG